MTWIELVKICNHCEYNHDGTCLVDSKKQHINEIAASGHCPIGKYAVQVVKMPTMVSISISVVPSPTSHWPAWAEAIGTKREEGELGVGDTVHRLLGSTGEALQGFLKAVHLPCNCDSRRAEWNLKYPYPKIDHASPLSPEDTLSTKSQT